jgi:hypothetical protein
MEVPLWDQFQQRTVELSRVEQFCDAVDKNDEIIIDSTAHLTCYKVKKPVSSTKQQVTSTDQFGDLGLSVKRGRTQLCVPSTAVAVVDPTPTPTTAPPPTPTASPTAIPGPPLEQFELYKVKKARGASRFERREVDLVDPFLGLDETVKLTRTMNLGAPTAEFYKDIVNPLTHLTCYKVQAPRFVHRDVFVTNRFDAWYKLTVKKPEMLCVPSYKLVVYDD